MALNASDVSAGDDILAAHHNALIDDIEQHTHEGTDTTKVPVENLDYTNAAPEIEEYARRWALIYTRIQ